MRDLNFRRVLSPLDISAQVHDPHSFQSLDSGARDGIESVGAEIRNDMPSQKTAVHQPADPPIENRPIKLNRLQVRQCR
jgi:hypothetical protein